MTKKKPQKINTRVIYTIKPEDKCFLLDDLLEERTELEIKQLFLEAEITKQLDQEPEKLPPVSKALEMKLNALRIEELTILIERLED